MGIKRFFKNMFTPCPPGLEYIGEERERNKSTLLIDEIVYAFEDSLELCSTPRTIIPHTAYVAYIPQHYFNALHITFGLITKEIVDIFHEKLKERQAKNRKLKFAPVYGFWTFNLIPLPPGSYSVSEGEDSEDIITPDDLEERFVAVRSSLIPEHLFDFSSVSEDTAVRTNRSQPNSTFNNMQVLTIGAISGLNPDGSGYTYPINLNEGQVTDANSQASATCDMGNTAGKVLAVLETADFNVFFTDKTGNNFQKLDIKLPHFFIGGSAGTNHYHGLPMVHLSSESVMSPHLEIKQDSDGAFYIRPIGMVELNQREIPRGEWSRLSDRNSSIKINSDIELIFNKRR